MGFDLKGGFMDKVSSLITGKKILVTGGTGSIGSEIVRRVLAFSPEVVRVYSRGEYEQFLLEHQLIDYKDKLRYLVGDVRDKERLTKAMEDIDIVFHAAALKQVPSCEYNPFEAVKTNVVGTQNIIDTAIACKVSKVVAISTDKAISPVNVMGATKLLSERLFSAANRYKGDQQIVFSSVRFGNVLNSRGSVVPLFRQQIESGIPVTITDPNMTRFMMTIRQAVDLVLKVASNCEGGEIFILKMPVMRIGDIMDVMIEEISKSKNTNPDDVQVRVIGQRDGEKKYEALLSLEEAENAFENDELFAINVDRDSDLIKNINLRRAGKARYTSETADVVGKEDVRAFLKREGLV